MVTVAMAPCTTSMRMMNIRKSRSALQQPKNPQKMRRAKASRKVSLTRARVVFIDVAPPAPRYSLWLHGLHKYILESAPRTAQRFNLASIRAQQIDCMIGLPARCEQQLQRAVVRSEGTGAGAQFGFERLGHMYSFDAVTAAAGERLDGSAEREFALLDDS